MLERITPVSMSVIRGFPLCVHPPLLDHRSLHLGTSVIQEDLILIWLHLQRLGFQKRPHSEVLRVRIETCFLGGENIILFAIIMSLFPDAY